MSIQNDDQQKVLYWNIGSQPGRAVKALIDIGHVKCKLVSIDLMTREQKSKQYLQKYPLGKIPFFTKGSLKIGESNAIMIYLYETQTTIPRHYYGQTAQERAKVNQYLSWYQSYFRPKMFKPIIMFLGSALLGKAIYQNQKSDSMNEVHEALQTLDNLLRIQFTKNDQVKFICGTSHPTIADLLVFFEVTNVVLFGIDQNKYTNLGKWFRNVYSINEVKTITHQWYPIGKQLNQMFNNVEIIKSKL